MAMLLDAIQVLVSEGLLSNIVITTVPTPEWDVVVEFDKHQQALVDAQDEGEHQCPLCGDWLDGNDNNVACPDCLNDVASMHTEAGW